MARGKKRAEVRSSQKRPSRAKENLRPSDAELVAQVELLNSLDDPLREEYCQALGALCVREDTMEDIKLYARDMPEMRALARLSDDVLGSFVDLFLECIDHEARKRKGDDPGERAFQRARVEWNSQIRGHEAEGIGAPEGGRPRSPISDLLALFAARLRANRAAPGVLAYYPNRAVAAWGAWWIQRLSRGKEIEPLAPANHAAVERAKGGEPHGTPDPTLVLATPRAVVTDLRELVAKVRRSPPRGVAALLRAMERSLRADVLPAEERPRRQK